MSRAIADWLIEATPHYASQYGKEMFSHVAMMRVRRRDYFTLD